MQIVIALEPAGRQVINKVSVPVYRLPNGGKYVEQTDDQGRTLVLSLEGALALKNGQYPLHHTITPRTSRDHIPFALQTEAEQSASAKATLRAMMTRLIDVKAPFNTASAN